jgi:hypothetical protein
VIETRKKIPSTERESMRSVIIKRSSYSVFSSILYDYIPFGLLPGLYCHAFSVSVRKSIPLVMLLAFLADIYFFLGGYAAEERTCSR